MACQGMTEAQLECKEPNSEDMESRAEYQEVPKEHAIVKPVGRLRKRHRGGNLAAEHNHKPQERTQGNCGFRRNWLPLERR